MGIYLAPFSDSEVRPKIYLLRITHGKLITESQLWSNSFGIIFISLNYKKFLKVTKSWERQILLRFPDESINKVEEILVVENCPLCSHSLQFLLFDRQNNHHSFFFFFPQSGSWLLIVPYSYSLVAAAFVSKRLISVKKRAELWSSLKCSLRPAERNIHRTASLLSLFSLSQSSFSQVLGIFNTWGFNYYIV